MGFKPFKPKTRRASAISAGFRPYTVRVNDSVRLHGNLITKISKTNFIPKKPNGFDKRSEGALSALRAMSPTPLATTQAYEASKYRVLDDSLSFLVNFAEQIRKKPFNIRFRSSYAKEIDEHKAVLEKNKQLLEQLGLPDADINYLLKV